MCWDLNGSGSEEMDSRGNRVGRVGVGEARGTQPVNSIMGWGVWI